MAKKRVHEIAKEKGISSKEVLAVLQGAGIDVKAAASSVDEAEIERAFSAKNGGGDAPAAEQAAEPKPKAAPTQEQPAKPAARPQRPVRSDGGGGGGAAGARRRRVVIDSQASRRQQGPPPPQQPPRRRGRRRRTPWVEPDLNAPAPAPVEEPPTPVNSGATVGEIAESLGLSSAEVIKKLMELGEMATLTQTLPDEAIEVLADSFEK